MKTIYLIGSLLFLNLSLFSQINEIKNLSRLRGELIEKKLQISDSIKNIDMRINFLKMKNRKQEVGSVFTRTTTNAEAEIQNKPELRGEIIGSIQKGVEVKLFEFVDGYWLIERASLRGYIDAIYLNENTDIQEKRKEEENKRIIEKYGPEIGGKILHHEVWIGMSIEMARLSIGNHPNVSKKRKSKFGDERWVYKSKYLDFEDSILVGWKNPQKSIKSKMWN